MGRLFTIAVASTCLAALPCDAAELPEYGPASGTLLAIGGGSLRDSGILDKFVELAGGPDKKFIVVPTARGNRNADGSERRYEPAQILGPWLRLGLKNVKMLHTADRTVANSDAFVRDLQTADAVWFDGGRQWNLVDSYAGTKTLAEFHNVLKRGGVIAGTSAGATIQGDYLVRGDTAGPQIMMTAEADHQSGFKFLRGVAIDQHVDARNRWNDLIPVVRTFPELLGIGLSENTAIIVRGDRFEIVGLGKVAIHEAYRGGTQPDSSFTPYLLLNPGQRFNLKTRAVEP